jgi:hypothetical protein
MKQDPKINWQEPLPFTNNVCQQAAYPIDSLPSIIKDQYGQQPIPLIACSALANISLACQSLANVARDHLLTSPISLYFLIVAQSGERKSAVDKAFSSGIRIWQQNIIEKFMPEMVSSSIIYQAWASERDNIIKQLRRANSEQDTLFIQNQLKELIRNEPSVKLIPELFFEDTTQEALVTNLSDGWPSSSLWSDEASIVLSGHGMQNGSTKFISTLNRLWDGNSFVVHRKTSRNFVVRNRRLTVSLMLQPLLLLHLLQRHGGMSRQSEFLARNLMTHPVSAMGGRLYKNPPKKLIELETFHSKITECLNQSLSLDSKGCHKIPTLTFLPKSKKIWINFFNDIENGLTNQHKWLDIQDFASKSSENVARLSALLHLFEGKSSSKIGTESVEQAIDIIHWHLLEAKRILGDPSDSQGNQDAIKLINWIKSHNLKETSTRHLQQYSPVREKSKLYKALSLLIEHQYIKETVISNKTLLLINPHY